MRRSFDQHTVNEKHDTRSLTSLLLEYNHHKELLPLPHKPEFEYPPGVMPVPLCPEHVHRLFQRLDTPAVVPTLSCRRTSHRQSVNMLFIGV